MNIEFVTWDEAVYRLPEVGSTPDWSMSALLLYQRYVDSYAKLAGLVERPLKRVLEGEVCLVDGLPYLQQFTDFLAIGSSWMLDSTFCTNQHMQRDAMIAAMVAASRRWGVPVDVPSIPQIPGDLVAKVYNFDLGFKSKQRNEQRQAFALHTNYRVEPVLEIPITDVEDNFDYWVQDRGTPLFSQASSYAWCAACAEIGAGYILRFESDIGLAYCGFSSLGEDLVLAAFCQVGRVPRIGTAALAASAQWLRDHGDPKVIRSRRLLLSLPRFNEDLCYATYKGHVSNESFKFGSLFAPAPTRPERPYLCGDTKQWIL